jgi:hypothetical protein
MGPIALFDKSFLQSLSVDESVLFDHFFLSTICPLFYIETLADLEKAVREGRTPEEEVGSIAQKTPETHGTPCAHHAHMCLGELLGHKIPLTGQIPVAGGRAVNVEGRRGVVFEQLPEAEAFQRWQAREFLDVERRFAKIWRNSLNSVDLQAVAERMRSMGINSKTCRSLEDAKKLADDFVRRKESPLGKLRLLMLTLGLPLEFERVLALRWELYAYIPSVEYAPYAAHMLSVEIFFQIALAANLIGTARKSNRTDIAYLFYLPFCMIFVSSDRLHERIVPHYLRSDQSFVWGEDLKRDLQTLVERYRLLPQEEQEKGLIKFAPTPPQDNNCLVTKLWNHHFGLIRQKEREELARLFETDQEPLVNEPKRHLQPLPKDEQELLKRLKEFSSAPELPQDQIDFDVTNPDMLSLVHRVRPKKGSFWQLPKDLKQKPPEVREQH